MKLTGSQGNLAVVWVLVAWIAPVARGDLMIFSQVGGSSPVSAGDPLEVDVALQLTSVILSVDMDVRVDTPLGTSPFGSGAPPNFVYDSGFLLEVVPSGTPLIPDFSMPRFVSNIGGAFGSDGPVFPNSFPDPELFLVGTFSIDTTDLLDGDYFLEGDAIDFVTSGEGGNPAIFAGTFSFTVTSSVVPAPGAFLLGAVGLGFVGWFRRRAA